MARLLFDGEECDLASGDRIKYELHTECVAVMKKNGDFLRWVVDGDNKFRICHLEKHQFHHVATLIARMHGGTAREITDVGAVKTGNAWVYEFVMS